MEKVVKKGRLSESSEIRDNLEYWLSRTPEERVEAVEILRRQRDGNSTRLQRVVRIIKRA
jgi:hypothetical protein